MALIGLSGLTEKKEAAVISPDTQGYLKEDIERLSPTLEHVLCASFVP